MSAHGRGTFADVENQDITVRTRAIIYFGGRRRMLGDVGGQSIWWARQDSNLQRFMSGRVKVGFVDFVGVFVED